MAKFNRLHLVLGVVAGIAATVAYVAYRTRRVVTPRRRWSRFTQRGTVELMPQVCEKLQGIYAVEEGNDFVGDTVVVKCSYTVEKGRKVYHLSFFCEKNGVYFICEGRQQGSTVLLYGHWRKAAANGAGLVQWVVAAENGANALLQDEDRGGLLLEGLYGSGNRKPTKRLVFRQQSELPQNLAFDIIGHRGGARNVDFLSVSENSLEMMKLAARLGATGVEIDVRMTKDGVPVIFHDSFLSIHTVKGKVYGGLVHNYTLRELKKIRLRKGGKIPTLEECLHTIVHHTPLKTVWLDIKKECDMSLLHALQQRFLREAESVGRHLNIYLGIPDKYVLKCFTAMENHREVPSLTELEIDLALEIGANVWAPQYTRGFQSSKVEKIQAAGGKAFVWSLDSKLMIEQYMVNGGFDGLVTNTPAVVAHWFYTAQAQVAM